MPFTLGFRSPTFLTDHFTKHSARLGVTSETDYETLADTFCGKTVGGTIRDGKCSDGDTLLYDEVTNEFAVIAPDNYIRTYYKPDPAIHGFATNLAYFLDRCTK